MLLLFRRLFYLFIYSYLFVLFQLLHNMSYTVWQCLKQDRQGKKGGGCVIKGCTMYHQACKKTNMLHLEHKTSKIHRWINQHCVCVCVCLWVCVRESVSVDVSFSLSQWEVGSRNNAIRNLVDSTLLTH